MRVRRRRFLQVIGRHGFGSVIKALGVVHELDVGAGKGAACRDVVGAVLPLRNHGVEVLVQAFFHALGDERGERLKLAGLDCLVGGCDRRLDEPCRLETGLTRTFACAMNAHERLEKV